MMGNQKGFALIAALGIMLIGSLMIAAIFPLVINSLNKSIGNKDDVAAQYAAEAGAKRAVAMFNKSEQDWDWLDTDENRPTWHMMSNKENEQYHVKIALSKDGELFKPREPATPNVYYVFSTGKVNNATKKVSVKVEVKSDNGGSGGNEGNGGVFSNYTVYSNKNMNISNTPKIIGNIGSNGSISVWGCSNNAVSGTAYANQLSGYSQVMTGGYKSKNPVGTLNVSSLMPPMPPMPTIPANGTNLASLKSSNLSGGFYYSTDSYELSKPLTVMSGQSAIIYINGNLKLTSTGSEGVTTYGSISGDEITIYVKGDILLDNRSYLQSSTLKIYATGIMKLSNDTYINGNDITIQTKGNVTLANYSYIQATTLKIYTESGMELTNVTYLNGNDITIQTVGIINFNSSGSINKDSSTAITKIYSYGDVKFNNTIKIGGSAGLVVTTKGINVNSSIIAKNTIFIANSNSEVTNNAQICGIYTNGVLNINSSPKINDNNQIQSVLLALGLISNNSSPSIKVTSWRPI